MNNLRTLSLGAFLMTLSPVVTADQVIPDDLIVTGSSCIGTACVNAEVFDFDTLKLKTDDPLIKFVDTSVGSFPSNDWSMGITDNAAPGPANFFINDDSSGTTVLRMEAGSSGGIALGAGSSVESNAISVGAVGTERRIVHVADGVDATDAATMGQFSAFTAAVNNGSTATTLNADLLNLQSEIGTLKTRVDAIITRLNGG